MFKGYYTRKPMLSRLNNPVLGMGEIRSSVKLFSGHSVLLIHTSKTKCLSYLNKFYSHLLYLANSLIGIPHNNVRSKAFIFIIYIENLISFNIIYLFKFEAKSEPKTKSNDNEINF